MRRRKCVDFTMSEIFVIYYKESTDYVFPYCVDGAVLALFSR